MRCYTLVLLLLFACLPAKAEESTAVVGVVELFTSQGCSACPPADQAMKDLIATGKVIGLSYHVDYWDYLGWADTLATSGNTSRQYDYAEAMGRTGVYTPQAIINGQDHINGSDIDLINQTLEEQRAKGQGLSVKVATAFVNDEIIIDVGSGAGSAKVTVVYFSRSNEVKVERGDNAGATIDYWHNVRDIQVIGVWEGSAVQYKLPGTLLTKDNASGMAVLVQQMDAEGNPRHIIGANTLLSQGS
jgi:hypothetical protein